MRPFNFTDGPRQEGKSAAERARIHRWNVPGKSRVTHPAHGSVVVPHMSNLAAVMNAAEVWGCDWVKILDAEVWAVDPSEPAEEMPAHCKSRAVDLKRGKALLRGDHVCVESVEVRIDRNYSGGNLEV